MFKKTRQRVLGISAAIVAATLLVSCAPDEGGSESPGDAVAAFDTVTDGKLTIALSQGLPPGYVIQPDGSLDGLLGELLTKFAEENGLEVELLRTTFASLIPSLQHGTADISIAVYYTEERAQEVRYFAPYIRQPASLMMKKDFSYDGPESLNGHKVGAILGQVWAPYLQDALGDDLVQFEDQTSAAQALLNGQVTAYLNTNLQLFNEPLASQADNLYFAVIQPGDWGMPADILSNDSFPITACESTDLADAMDEFLNGLVASGEWQSMNEAWGIPAENQLLTPELPAQHCA